MEDIKAIIIFLLIISGVNFAGIIVLSSYVSDLWRKIKEMLNKQ